MSSHGKEVHKFDNSNKEVEATDLKKHKGHKSPAVALVKSKSLQQPVG